MTFRAQVTLGIGLATALLLFILIFAGYRLAMQEGSTLLESHADTAAQMAAAAVQDGLEEHNLAEIKDVVTDLVSSGQFVSVRVFDAQGRLIAAANCKSLSSDDLVSKRAPVTGEGSPIGSIVIQISDHQLAETLSSALRHQAVLAALVLLVAVFLSAMLGTFFTRQLQTIRRAAAQIMSGDFEIAIAETGAPEFRSLARAMNMMARRIRGLHAELRQGLADKTRSLQSTFAHMSEGVAIFDREGLLVAANDAFTAQLGFPADAVLAGTSLDALVERHEAGAPSDSKSRELSAKCRQIDWDGPSMQFEIPFPGNRIISVQRTRLLDGGFIAIHSDVTRQRRDERRLLHAGKLAALGELATATAHELNQPLNVIRLLADNMRARLADDRAPREYIDGKLARISEQTQRAAGIVDHLRVFGRKPAQAPELFDLSSAVNAAAEFFCEMGRTKGLELRLETEPGLIVHGHPAMVEQVVANLVSNAVAALKISGDGRKSPLVRVRTFRDEIAAFIEVADNAGGIAPEAMARIFEPFFTTKPSGEGTGLGLSISYGIVSDMGGTINARNDGDGAIFTVEIPFTKAA